MALPVAQDIRDSLEGYAITSTILSDAWITNKITNHVIPIVERMIRQNLSAVQSYTEYISGTGMQIILLSRRPVIAVTDIRYVTGGDSSPQIGIGGIEVIADQGILKAIANITEGITSRTFAPGQKNIKVTYTAGHATVPADIKEALILLTAEVALGQLGARSGGGSINVQSHGRTYGERGKYQDIRNDLKRQAMALLNRYKTSVVGR